MLGDSCLPGGTDLTPRLARALELRPGMRVADLACGRGTTAFLLACEFGVDVDGVDLGAELMAGANAKAAELELDDCVIFWVADTERLPFEDGSVDALIAEKRPGAGRSRRRAGSPAHGHGGARRAGRHRRLRPHGRRVAVGLTPRPDPGKTLGMAFEDVVDELYGLDAGEFVAARDERAREARGAGDRALADQVKGLKRPSAAAWVVNILVRNRPREIERLLRFGQSFREAQANLAGDELRRLGRQRHQVLGALGQEASRLAQERGQSVSQAVERDVESTLDAALTDETAAEAVRSGRQIGRAHV